MDITDIEEKLLAVAAAMPTYDIAFFRDGLIGEYIQRSTTWPEETRNAMILVLAWMTKLMVDSRDSSIAAAAVLASIRTKP